jgi:hypothetical protein
MLVLWEKKLEMLEKFPTTLAKDRLQDLEIQNNCRSVK